MLSSSVRPPPLPPADSLFFGVSLHSGVRLHSTTSLESICVARVRQDDPKMSPKETENFSRRVAGI